MTNFLKRAYLNYQQLLIIRGRKVARVVLLDKSDRELEDMGFSRELLQQGISQWPWRVDDDQAANESAQLETAAINTLQGMSDRELRDLGITRGTIEESVRHGRAGVDRSNAASPVSNLHNGRVRQPATTIENDREVA